MSIEEIQWKLADTYRMLSQLQQAKLQEPDSDLLRLSEKSLNRRRAELESALASAASAALDGNGASDAATDFTITTPVSH